MYDILKQIYTLLSQDEGLVLVTILEKSGSAPREAGTKMIIRKSGAIIGTIGGGALEKYVMDSAPSVFESGGYAVNAFDLTNEEASGLGMICGGHVTVLMECIEPSDLESLDHFKKAWIMYRQGISFKLITRLKSDYTLTGIDRWILSQSGLYGQANKKIETFSDIEGRLTVKKDRDTYVIENIEPGERAFIIGGGHIAEYIARYTKDLGFYTVVVDDRETFANRERFNTVDEVHVIPSYEKLAETLHFTQSSYVIIVTRGHSFDQEVLAQVLLTQAKYVGMIGSKKKKKDIYKALLAKGYKQEDLDSVYSPIGLSIGGKSPEEIAMSIAAEMIMVRHQVSGSNSDKDIGKEDSRNIMTLEAVEKEHIVHVLEANKGNIAKTARDLGIRRNTLYNKIAKYQIEKEHL